MNIKIQSLVSRVQQDKTLAAELKSLAEEAARAGPGTPEWDKLLEKFASSPKELATLKAYSNPENAEVFGTTTITTITTLTTFTV